MNTWIERRSVQIYQHSAPFMVLLVLALMIGGVSSSAVESRWLPDPKPRVTDISNESDDEES